MEGFMIRGWDPIIPSGAGFILEPQPSNDRPVELRFHAVRGGADTGDHRFRPRVAGVVDVWSDF